MNNLIKRPDIETIIQKAFQGLTNAWLKFLDGDDNVLGIGANDLAKLRKLMAMTASKSDGEALTALRMANKILESNQLAWKDVFDRAITVDQTIADEGEAYPIFKRGQP